MRKYVQRGLIFLALLLALALPVRAADFVTWHTNDDRVSADIQSAELIRVLEGIAQITGWHVFLESNTTLTVSTKFKDVPSGEALRLLFPNLNYALVPQTNGPSFLYVFRTTRQNARQQVQAGNLGPGKARDAKVIPNELIVRLKPGANIDEIAKRLGATVVGKIEGLNAYRLRFDDAAAAESARAALAGDPQVASVESNYVIDQPPPVAKLDMANPPPPVKLTLNPPENDPCHVVVGLVDTAVQPTGTDLDKFLKNSYSVAGKANLDSTVPSHGTSMYQDLLRGAESATKSGGSSMQIISVDVYGSNPTTSSFDVAAGITVAINNGANVVNLSLGSPGDSAILHDVIAQAAQNGIPVFAAAGNDATSQPFYPAAYPEVISVAAGTQGKLAPYSNYGDYIKLMVPGSAVVYFNNTPYVVSGTSTASALSTGIAAGAATANCIGVNAAAKKLMQTPQFRYSAQ